MIINLIISILCIAVIFTSCDGQSTEKIIKNEIGVDISGCIIESDKDSHTGFLGDGETLVTIDCSQNKDEILNQISGWNKLPLTENLQIVMYGDNEGNGYRLAYENGIPEITDGYYKFINRHDEAKSKSSDSGMLEAYSMNFTLALYDSETDIMYYYEFDS